MISLNPVKGLDQAPGITLRPSRILLRDCPQPFGAWSSHPPLFLNPPSLAAAFLGRVKPFCTRNQAAAFSLPFFTLLGLGSFFARVLIIVPLTPSGMAQSCPCVQDPSLVPSHKSLPIEACPFIQDGTSSRPSPPSSPVPYRALVHPRWGQGASLSGPGMGERAGGSGVRRSALRLKSFTSDECELWMFIQHFLKPNSISSILGAKLRVGVIAPIILFF